MSEPEPHPWWKCARHSWRSLTVLGTCPSCDEERDAPPQELALRDDKNARLLRACLGMRADLARAVELLRDAHDANALPIGTHDRIGAFLAEHDRGPK